MPGKNIRLLAGHPLIAYTISATKMSGVFRRIVVSTDSETYRSIALHYGAEVPFLRPVSIATAKSPDIEWITHAFDQLKETCDAFGILRPTSPFRQAETIKRAAAQFLTKPYLDSLRAVELCRQHPGKMWIIKDETMRPLLDQSQLAVPWHSSQFQTLPKIYVQNSSLEFAWSRVLTDNSISGKAIAPFLTNYPEGLTLDYEEDWYLAERLIETGKAKLPTITKKTVYPARQ